MRKILKESILIKILKYERYQYRMMSEKFREIQLIIIYLRISRSILPKFYSFTNKCSKCIFTTLSYWYSFVQNYVLFLKKKKKNIYAVFVFLNLEEFHFF